MDSFFEPPSPDRSDSVRWNLIERKAQEWRLKRAFAIFRERGVEPILIKGWAIAIHYPPSHHRVSIDIDLAVSSLDFELARSIAQDASNEGLAIDLHCELRHLDTVDWASLFSASLIVNVDECPIRVLRHEDHLRILCVHWLTDGGLNRERLWDIYYLFDFLKSDLDWHRFLGLVSEARRRWLVCTLGIANRYLDLDLSGTPIEDEAKNLPPWLIKCVEGNWASDFKHVPLEVVLFRPAELFVQLGNRLFPNPISSTVLMEGSFDAKTRIHYKLGSFVKRVLPSFDRMWCTVQLRSR